MIQRYQSIDLWRGIACLLIVITHSLHVVVTRKLWAATSGWDYVALQLHDYAFIGVPIFFVISGYCITAAAELMHQKNHSLSHYTLRRLRRIYPSYYAALLFQIGFVWCIDTQLSPQLLSHSIPPFHSPSYYSWSQWIGNLTLTETWRYHVFGDPRKLIIGQAWTLCYEEQFYFLMGLFIFLMRKRLLLALILTSAFTAFTSASSHLRGIFIDGSWLMFACGGFAYYAIHEKRRSMWLILAIIAIGGQSVEIVNIKHAFITQSALFAALLIWLHPWDKTLASSRAGRVLTYVGIFSYSLYLIQSVVVRAISQYFYNHGYVTGIDTLITVIPLCMGAALLIGWLFYQLVERHFLSHKHRNTMPEPRETR